MLDKPRARAAAAVCATLLLGSCVGGTSQHPGPESCGGDESATLLHIRSRDGSILDSRSVPFASEQPLLAYGDDLVTISERDGTHMTTWDERLENLWSTKVFDSEYVRAFEVRGSTAVVTSEYSIATVSLEDKALQWAHAFAPGQPVGAAEVGRGAIYIPVGRDLVALDLQSGDELWRVQFESHPVTPLIRGAVITGASRPSHGDEPGPLRALDQDTGELIWEGPQPDNTAFRPDTPISVGRTIVDKEAEVGGGSLTLTGLQPESGTVAWERTFGRKGLWEFVFATSDHLVLSPGDGIFSVIDGDDGSTSATGQLARRHHLFDVAKTHADLLLASRTNRTVDVRAVRNGTASWVRELQVSRIPLFGGAVSDGHLLRLIDQQQQHDASLALLSTEGGVIWRTRMPHALVERPVSVNQGLVVLSSDPAPACI